MKLDEIQRRIVVNTARSLSKLQSWMLSRAFGEPFWVDTYGTAYTYKELSRGHLKNILRKLLRDGDDQTEVFAALEAEAKSRRLKWRPKRRDPWA